MGTSRRSIRGLVAVGLAIGLVVGACSSSSTNPLAGGGGGGAGAGGNGSNGSSLASGLTANLDKLDSYQFSWSFSSTSSTPTSGDSGSFGTSGIVVNKPTKAYKINDLGMLQVIAIGSQGWTSFDNGSTWTADSSYSADSSSVTALLPDSLYGSDFDSNATNFSSAGDETKNGIACVHYTGNSDLGAIGGIAGVSATFKADLWVAKDGNYPVSGFYGWTASSGGEAGSWGYTFDVTHVNDAANVVTAPTNVQAAPSY